MNFLNSLLSSSPILADSSVDTSYLKSVTDSVQDFLEAAIPFVWIVAALALAGTGLMCIVGGDKTKEAAKSKIIYVIVGCGIVLGALYLGSAITEMLTVNSTFTAPTA